jgi:hypothetical protein
MAFVVKITNRADLDCWLSRANQDGDRAVAFRREFADTFQTYEDANVASRRSLEVLKGGAFMFFVESTD